MRILDEQFIRIVTIQALIICIHFALSSHMRLPPVAVIQNTPHTSLGFWLPYYHAAKLRLHHHMAKWQAHHHAVRWRPRRRLARTRPPPQTTPEERTVAAAEDFQTLYARGRSGPLGSSRCIPRPRQERGLKCVEWIGYPLIADENEQQLELKRTMQSQITMFEKLSIYMVTSFQNRKKNV